MVLVQDSWLAVGILPFALNAGCGRPPCEETLTCPPSTIQAGGGGNAGTNLGGIGGGGRSDMWASGFGGAEGGAPSQAPGGSSGTSTGGTGGILTNAGNAGDTALAGHSSYGGASGARDSSDAGEAGDGGTSARCGNGTIEASEECDDGIDNGSGKRCNALCKENVCGDGDRGPTEGCDDGTENGLELLRCAPDCSRIIEVKHILVAERELTDERLQPNPIAKADAECPAGYKALFAYGSQRRATTIPFKSANAVDWVLRPYTYYVNSTENLIWLTRDVPLLGVETGQFSGLLNTIGYATRAYISNLNVDGTTFVTDNCDGWSTSNSSYSKHFGMSLFTDAGYLDHDVTSCGHYVTFYCVEQ